MITLAHHPITVLNVDRNVSFRDYRDIEGKKLKLVGTSPIFYTFQGEGPDAGKPCVFVRTAGCNIGAKEDCSWCDTKFFIDTGVDWELQAIIDQVKLLARGRTNLIVLTGGEPLLQSKSVELFGQMCREQGLTIQVESNGYFVAADSLPGQKIVVSPKIPHNKGHYLPYKLAWLERKVHLKYVVSSDPESLYHRLPADVLADKDHFGGVYVSAMCIYKRNTNPGEIPNIWDETLVDRVETARNYVYAAELALEHGLRVSYQTHLFGAKE